jgi:hypothetical protein
MREWVKVILGVLALTIGASAPTLILEALRPGSLVALNVPSPSGGDAQEKQKEHTAEHHNDRYSTQDGSVKAPSIQQHQSPGQHSVAPKPQGEGEWYTGPDWWVAIFTALLFLATTGLWFFTALLWRATRTAVLEGQQAISAAQRSADAANRHARAAQDANRINREALITANRPWIKIEIDIPEDEPLIFTAEDIEVTINIRLKNIGRSPATRINVRIEFYPDLQSAWKRVSSLWEIDMPSGGTYGAGRMLFPDESFSERHTRRTSAIKFRERIGKPIPGHEEDGPIEQDRPAIMGAAWYYIPGAPLPKHTVIVGEIVDKSRRRYGFDGSEGTFPGIEFEESIVSGEVT